MRTTKTSIQKKPTPPSDFSGDSEVQGLGRLFFLVVSECEKACKGYFLWFAGLARGRNGAFLGFAGAASEEKGVFFAVARCANS